MWIRIKEDEFINSVAIERIAIDPNVHDLGFTVQALGISGNKYKLKTTKHYDEAEKYLINLIEELRYE